MPVLRRPHDRHRDLRPCCPGARAAILACPYRGRCVVTRHDKPRAARQAAVLRTPGKRVPAAITGPPTARMTIRSDRPAPSRQVDGTPADRSLRPRRHIAVAAPAAAAVPPPPAG